MTLDWSFEPNAARAELMDRRMGAELASSLGYICDSVGEDLAVYCSAIRQVCKQLEEGSRFAPELFGQYYHLVRAIQADDIAAATTMAQAIGRARPTPKSQSVLAIGLDLSPERSQGYIDMLQDEEPQALDLAAPTRELAARFQTRFGEAMAMLDVAAPELASEIRTLAHEVVIVGQRPGATVEFDGGSHFQLWGALFLNAARARSAVQMAEVIAHECAHSLLFGFCIDEPLTLNADEELYSSPLRTDPRPMDGLYHAAFVSARMHWTLSRLIESDVLDAQDRSAAMTARETDRCNFLAARAVVAEHGRLSAVGTSVLQGADLYMASAA